MSFLETEVMKSDPTLLTLHEGLAVLLSLFAALPAVHPLLLSVLSNVTGYYPVIEAVRPQGITR